MSRELDAEVAEKVMGFYKEGKPRGTQWICRPGGKRVAEKTRGCEWAYFGRSGEMLPYYSTSISDAWLVVEEMRRRMLKLDLQGRGEGWRARFWMSYEMQNKPLAIYGTASEAICMAAIAALEAVGE